MSSLLSLSSVNNLEQKIKKELRFYNTFLLAGNREHERNAWNILIDVTNNFSNRHLHQIEKDESSSSSSSWIAEGNLLADVTWNQYTGDIILTLLALVGSDADLWMSQKREAEKKSDAEDKKAGNLTFTHPLTQTESRLHRYLLPHEKITCKNLYFEIIFQNDDSFKSVVANKFDILLPLLLSFSSPTTTSKTSENESDKSSDFISLPPASSGILRSIVAASITGLLLSSNNSNSSSPSPLFSILYSTVCEKSDLPPSIMMESGFRIAEVLAAPPVTHGSILQTNALEASASRKKSGIYYWKPKLTASEIVQYYSSILHQIGNDVLIRVNPNTALSSSSKQQQHGIFSTNMRMLCATLFLIGRIAAPATKLNPSQSSSKVANVDEYEKLRTMLSSTFLLPRLVLIDRELLGPCFGSLIRTTNDFSESNDITLSLKKLESLLAALEVAPTMVLSNTVEKSVIGIVVLIWEKIGTSVVDIAFSPSEDDIVLGENKLIARRCITYILSSIAERILRSNSSTSNPTNNKNNFEENMFLHNVLFQPFVDIILRNFSQVDNNNTNSPQEDDEANADPVATANQALEDFIDLIFKTAASIVVVAVVPNSASTTNIVPSIATTAPSSSSSSSHVDIVATLILTEFFRVCVHSQESRGKDSSSDRAHTLFISLLLSKISPKQMMFAASQVHSSVENSILFLDQLLRFCKWSLRALWANDRKTEMQINGLALITLDLIANLQEDDYVGVLRNDKNDFTFAFLLVLKTIEELQIEISKISTTHVHEKQESALRTLEILKKRFSLEMIESRQPETSSSSDADNISSLAFDNLVRDFVKLFQEMRNLHERKMFSILTVTLMELCDKVRQIPQVFKKILVDSKHQHDSPSAELWTRLVNQEIFEKEIDYLVKNILLKSSSAAAVADSNSNNNNSGKNNDASFDQQNTIDSSKSSKSAAAARRPLKRFNAVGASAARMKNNGEDCSKSEGAVSSPPSVVSNTKDDQVVSAACSLLSLICLFRLDTKSNKEGEKVEETKASPSSIFYNLLSQCLGEALHQAGTKIDDGQSNSDKNTLSILSGFAATMLDVVVRVADDDSEGLTLRRIFFAPNKDSGKVLFSSPETLCLEIVRANDSENIYYQAVRLCCLNVLAKCYQLVPLKCNFDVVESVIVGIFRAQSSQNNNNQQRQNDNETLQILRLAAAALLSGIIPAAVASILASKSGEEIILGTFKKIKTFCGHVAQYRNPLTPLFDAEIREHGRIAEKHLRAALPEELVAIVFFEEAGENSKE